MATETLLTLRGVSKAYNAGEPVLEAINLTLHENEIIAVVGNSGSGKTTLLRAIAGLEEIDGGEITLAGRVVSAHGHLLPPAERRIGYIFQEHALFPHLTIRKNIEFGIHRRSTSERNRIVADLLTLLQISEIAPRYPHQISGGQLQRAGIARALAPRPRLLLLDEPFNNLDIALREAILPDLQRLLKKQRIAALCITHLPQEGFVLADRIAVLDTHRIVQVGEPRQLYRRPANRDIAQFFGLINCFTARYSHRERLIYLSDRLFFAPQTENGLPHSGGDTDSTVELLLRPDEIELFFDRSAHECHRADLLLLNGEIRQKKYFGHFQLLTIHINEAGLSTECIAHLPAKTTVRIKQRVLVGLPMNSVHLVTPR